MLAYLLKASLTKVKPFVVFVTEVGVEPFVWRQTMMFLDLSDETGSFKEFLIR